jgi:hypothetical protein
MMIINEEALKERARALYAPTAAHNGIRMVLVSIERNQAILEVHFYSRKFFDEIISAAGESSVARRLFPITGGRRVLAGDATGQVQVIAVEDPGGSQPVLKLTVNPIGDYSTYTLGINTKDYPDIIDPLFSEIDFKFRPGCFSIECAPEWEPAAPPKDNPVIDYLAKDYHSFKHVLIAAMAQRVPGWQPTSEADLDQVLLELFCAAADELSDYQDRVMNEAYLVTSRKRVSLTRHARLMDYHIHQGNQASTWLAVRLQENSTLDISIPSADSEERPTRVTVWAGSEKIEDPSAVVFMSRTAVHLHYLLDQLGLYTWDGAIPALATGSTSADLQLLKEDTISPGNYLPINDQNSAIKVQDLIRSGTVNRLLIQEWLNPATGRADGRDPEKRQLLRLLPDAEAMWDPVKKVWFVRVHWGEQDALKANYCFTVNCNDGKKENISLFHGNLVPVYHGRQATTIFKDPKMPLTAENEFHYEPTVHWGTVCRLPSGPLAYLDIQEGGEIPPRSTLEVEVVIDGASDPWDEVISLVHSDDSAERGDHFMVETDEAGQSLIRFGNGVNGRGLPDGAEVHCTYQVGRGLDGNIGADTLIYFNALTYSEIRSCWNPFDVTNGRAPEPVAEIVRRAPEAYRSRQLRAVTLQDYEDRAEELPEVARAAARYAWTGSWRTVQVAVDPVGTSILSPELRQRVADHLNAVRLIGEDLEIRPPRPVPLDIHVSLCVHPDYWIEDVRFLLEQEFSEGYTRDGRKAFFHPDRWTFGQKLYASDIIGRIQRIEGVDHVVSVIMKRWNEPTPGKAAIADVRANEIIRVRNDPDHMEDGFMTFSIGGGRQ